jgi:phosphotransferase family enzyme
VTEEAPLAGLLARALGTDVADVRSEPLGARDGVDRERVRFTADGAQRSLVFERLAPRNALEVQLLPFLARKTAHVPVVHARGIPPPTVPAPQWLLLEDLEDVPSACEREPRRIVDALIAVQQAVAADGPALRALGVPQRSPADIAESIVEATAGESNATQVGYEARESARRLQKWPATLVHGDLSCANAVATERGVVLLGWRSAHVGCALLDVVRLVADLVERDDAVRGIGLTRVYAETIDVILSTEVLRGAEKLDRLARRYLRE